MNPIDQQILNDVGVIYNSAFNHSRPIKGETSHFMKGFDGKKGVDAKEVLQASRDITEPLSAKRLPECLMMGSHVTQLCEQVKATEALLKGLCGAEEEWATRHEGARTERGAERNAALIELEEERKVAFDAIDKAAEQAVKNFGNAQPEVPFDS